MNTLKNHSKKQNNQDDPKSESTIQLEFSESVVQMLATTYDNNSNSYLSSEQYYSRKRCASRENQNTIDEQENMNKKQRNNNDHLAFSENARNQQIVSLSESDESQSIRTKFQQQNGRNIFQLRKTII